MITSRICKGRLFNLTLQKMPVRRIFLQSLHIGKTFTRSAFTAKKPDYANPNWFRVGLALGSTVALWTLLLKQHNEDVQEYKRRNGLL